MDIKNYINIAQEVAQLSNDWHTKVGAVFVKNNKILSTGYNSSPIGFDTSLIPKNNGETLIQQKNTYMIHAEMNAILNYKGNITDLKGSTIYVTLCPCSQCAKILIQLGVEKVVYLEEYLKQETMTAKYMFSICNIICQQYNKGELI